MICISVQMHNETFEYAIVCVYVCMNANFTMWCVTGVSSRGLKTRSCQNNLSKLQVCTKYLPDFIISGQSMKDTHPQRHSECQAIVEH